MMEVKGMRVIVTDLDQGERRYGSIIVQDDNGKRHGIRSRWCKVYKVGEKVTEIKPGDWVLVEHGRWSQAFQLTDEDGNKNDYWVIDYPKYVTAVADEKPEHWNFGNE